MTQKKLEDYKWFPYVAWTLSIGFFLFVLNLTLELRATAAELQESTMSLSYQLEQVERMLAPETATTSEVSSTSE